MRRAQIDQAGLLATGDDLDAMAEQRLGPLDQRLAVGRIAQRVGAHHPQVTRGDVLEEGGEACQAVQRALHRRFAKPAVLVEAGGKLDLLAKAGHHLQAVILIVGHQQVEAVGAEIDRGEPDGVAGHGSRNGGGSGGRRVLWRSHGSSFGSVRGKGARRFRSCQLSRPPGLAFARRLD